MPFHQDVAHVALQEGQVVPGQGTQAAQLLDDLLAAGLQGRLHHRLQGVHPGRQQLADRRQKLPLPGVQQANLALQPGVHGLQGQAD